MNRHRAVTRGAGALLALALLAEGACARGGDTAPAARYRSITLAAPPSAEAADTMIAVRAARRALDDSTRMAVEAAGSFTLAGVRFAVARVESTYGTGFYQTAYFVVPAASGDVAPWTALATERFTPGGPVTDPPYTIGSCLYVVDDSLLGYFAGSESDAGRAALADASKGARMPADSVARRNGLYRWDAATRRFAYADAGDASAAGCSYR